MLAAFLCPVIVVEFYTILGPILVFTFFLSIMIFSVAQIVNYY